jgi:hypothetical protein
LARQAGPAGQAFEPRSGRWIAQPLDHAQPNQEQRGAATTSTWSSWTTQWVPVATPGIPPSTSARAWCRQRSAFVSTRTATDPPGTYGSMGSTFARGCIGASTRWPHATRPSRGGAGTRQAPAESWLHGVRRPLSRSLRCAASGCSRGHHVCRFRYPSRLTLAWRLVSRTAGPSTSGGGFVCWLVGTTTQRRRSAACH